MSKKAGWRELDSNANEALRRYFDRVGGWGQVDSRTPLHEMLMAEDDGHGEPPGEYEFDQRRAAIRGFYRFLKMHGESPVAMLKQLAAAGRAFSIEPFAKMTMEEIGNLFSESKAAHSWRCKVLSREIELSGMRGIQLPGQKKAAASEVYRRIRKGNTNRKGGKNRTRQRQGSFLKKLHVPKESKK